MASATAAAFLLAGCSKAVQVPEKELAPSTEWKGLYRVTTTTDEFTTRHFSVMDSTLVITKLGGSDEHYGIARLPISISLADVRAVERLETRHGTTTMVVIGVALLGAFVFFVSTFTLEGLD